MAQAVMKMTSGSILMTYIVYVLTLPSAMPFVVKSTVENCSRFKAFVERYKPNDISEWVRENCDKIKPRPKGMSCEDVMQVLF